MSSNQSLNKKNYEPLAQALQGQSDKAKSRVYNLIVNWGIDPENEFFLIFVAMGQLVALVEEAPHKFDTSFEKFTEGIDLWTQTNINILNEIASKATINERLAGGAEKLAESSTQLVQVCSELIVQLKDSNGGEISSPSQQLTSEENYGILLKIISEKLSLIETLVSNPPQRPVQNKAVPNLIPKNEKLIWSVNFSLLGLLILSCLSNFGYWRSLNQIEERTSWLLEKANRQDCLQGIKSAESIECKSLPSY